MKLPELDPAQALIRHGHPREALEHITDDQPQSQFLRAVCYRHLGQIEFAKTLMSQLLTDPDPRLPLPALWNTYGMIQTDLGKFEDALFCFQQAFEILAANPNSPICSYDGNSGGPQIALNLAYSLMRLGRFKEAWPLWESSRCGWSWETPLVPWAGEPGRVLVVPEGGVGDQILFSRWITEAEESGAELTYYVHEELIDLLPKTIRRVIPKPSSVDVSRDPYPNIDWAKFDFGTSVMSLPAICGMKSISDIPTDTWEPYCKSRHGLAGLCWAAEESGLVQRKTRSIPVEDFEPLRSSVNFVSICPGRPHPDWITKFQPTTWAETATMLQIIDFLVTCDTAVAHLAGALDVPTYVILPLGSDWKYFTENLVGNQSPWYPSVKLIRNTDPVSFRPAIELLMEELRKDGRT
jgi:hypothetical protein